MYVAVGDPSIDLADGIRCGVIALTEVPALGSTTITITAQEVVDAVGKQEWPLDECKQIFSSQDNPYLRYQYSIAGTGTSNGSFCDASQGSNGGSCLSQLIVRYASFITSHIESEHGKTPLDIWIEEAAIVGAVLTLGYFVTVFN